MARKQKGVVETPPDEDEGGGPNSYVGIAKAQLEKLLAAATKAAVAEGNAYTEKKAMALETIHLVNDLFTPADLQAIKQAVKDGKKVVIPKRAYEFMKAEGIPLPHPNSNNLFGGMYAWAQAKGRLAAYETDEWTPALDGNYGPGVVESEVAEFDDSPLHRKEAPDFTAPYVKNGQPAGQSESAAAAMTTRYAKYVMVAVDMGGDPKKTLDLTFSELDETYREWKKAGNLSLSLPLTPRKAKSTRGPKPNAEADRRAVAHAEHVAAQNNAFMPTPAATAAATAQMEGAPVTPAQVTPEVVSQVVNAPTPEPQQPPHPFTGEKMGRFVPIDLVQAERLPRLISAQGDLGYRRLDKPVELSGGNLIYGVNGDYGMLVFKRSSDKRRFHIIGAYEIEGPVVEGEPVVEEKPKKTKKVTHKEAKTVLEEILDLNPESLLDEAEAHLSAVVGAEQPAAE